MERMHLYLNMNERPLTQTNDYSKARSQFQVNVTFYIPEWDDHEHSLQLHSKLVQAETWKGKNEDYTEHGNWC